VTGALVFSTYVDVVFRGMESNVVQLRHTTQYSEIYGGVFEWAKNIIPVGITIITPPTITGYNPDSYVSDIEGVVREFNIEIDQPSDVIWYINGTVVKDTEKGVTSAHYTNYSAKTGHWNVSAVASNAKGTDMQTWWWTVNPCGFFTGNRIWEEGMGDPYRWTAQSFTGFYYDLDDGLSTEMLTITGIDRSLDEGSIVYETRPRSVNFDCSRWGKYDMIGFAAEKYFAGYNSDTDSDITDDSISLISNKMLCKVLIDEDDKHTISAGASFELKDGYELKIVQLNIQGDMAHIELLRDGNIVDVGIISNMPSTYTYTRGIGSIDNVPVIVIRVDSVFAGTESDMLMIKGIFQVSEDYRSIKTGDQYGEMEIKSIGSSGITMKNDDTISLDEGETVDLMGNIKFIVADASTLRFALYGKITEPGTHDIRGTVYTTTEMPTWTPMNFEGFYYDIDEDLGTEKLEIRNTGTSIDDGNLVYTTTVQSVRFDYGGWGKYDVIGFAAEKCFAGYNSCIDSDITDETISLVSNKMLSKVLIDSDKEHTVSTDAPLELEEGYELKLIRLDISGDMAQIELRQDGRSVSVGIWHRSNYVRMEEALTQILSVIRHQLMSTQQTSDRSMMFQSLRSTSIASLLALRLTRS
jgi:S-layer protein (TIGR01567 family)